MLFIHSFISLITYQSYDFMVFFTALMLNFIILWLQEHFEGKSIKRAKKMNFWVVP